MSEDQVQILALTAASWGILNQEIVGKTYQAPWMHLVKCSQSWGVIFYTGDPQNPCMNEWLRNWQAPPWGLLQSCMPGGWTPRLRGLPDFRLAKLQRRSACCLTPRRDALSSWWSGGARLALLQPVFLLILPWTPPPLTSSLARMGWIRSGEKQPLKWDLIGQWGGHSVQSSGWRSTAVSTHKIVSSSAVWTRL